MNFKPVSKYITLGSHAFSDYFPSNCHNDFWTFIQNSIDSNEPLEVGIVNMFYTLDPLKPKSNKLFAPGTDENIIKVVKHNTKECFVERSTQDINYFINEVNRVLGEKTFNVRIEYNIRLESIIVLQREVDHTFKFSQDFANAFGFIDNDFPVGDFRAPHSVDHARFKKLQSKLTMTLIKEEQINLTVQEPEVKNAEGLISEINKTLDLLKIRLEFSYDYNFLEFENEQDLEEVSVTLSNRINHIFGIPNNTFWTKTKKLQARKQPEFGLDSNFVLVLCNIIEAHLCMGDSKQVLQMFRTPLNVQNEFVRSENPNPTIYHRLESTLKSVQNIRIQLVDERLRPIELKEDAETVVVLHFKTPSDFY